MGFLIALSGKAGAGKDTAAEIIKEITSNDWQVMKFAGKLKEMTCVLLGCKMADLENHDFKSEPIPWLGCSPRFILQQLGDEWGRQTIHQDIWVNALMENYNGYRNWLITDCRFPSECKVVQSKGGIVIRINRDTEVVDTHPSETALDDYTEFDAVIDNNSTLEHLREEIYKCLQKHLSGGKMEVCYIDEDKEPECVTIRNGIEITEIPNYDAEMSDISMG